METTIPVESRTAYLNKLLRGYEIANGLETPSGDLPQRIGKEEELLGIWGSASAEDRAFVEDAIRETDRFIKDQLG